VYHISRRQIIVAGTAALAAAPYSLSGQTLQKVRIAGVPTDDFTPVYYGIKSGLYTRAGLDVEIMPTASGTAATTAVLTGTYELGKASLVAALAAHVKGLPVLIVGNSIIHDPKVNYAAALVAADSPIRTGADLNGKIGAAPGLNDINQLAISAWVDKNGGDSKSMRWVEAPNSIAAEALAEHRFEVCNLQEPALTAAMETGKVRILGIPYSAISEHFVYGGYLANADWAAKNADIVRRWVRATYAAAVYTNGHHAETEAMMADVTGIPLPTFQKIARAEAATTSDPTLLQPLIDAAVKYNQIPHGFPAKEVYFNS